MADLLEVADKRGVDLDLKSAYDRAIRIHPETAKVIEQRIAAQTTGNPLRSIQKAKVAASSVSGSPGVGSPAKTTRSLREDIMDSMDQVAGR